LIKEAAFQRFARSLELNCSGIEYLWKKFERFFEDFDVGNSLLSGRLEQQMIGIEEPASALSLFVRVLVL